MHHVVVLAPERVVAVDLAIPLQVFGAARPELGPPRYRVTICAVRRGPLATASGMQVVVEHGLDALARAGTVIVPGLERPDEPQPPPVLDALRDAAGAGRRMVSICTGAFVLAQAGVLDGLSATTHWQDAGRLQAQFPTVRVRPNDLYVDEGTVLTSAGVAAGVDLCLHIVRRDHGADYANAIARRMVVAPHRSGGQAQFIERPVASDPTSSLESTRAWSLQRLSKRLTVSDMARHASLSERHFARRFQAETGLSPLRWLVQQRVLEGRRLLETTDLPIESVADRAGFGTPEAMRVHFRQATATTPSDYRRTFRASGQERAAAR